MAFLRERRRRPEIMDQPDLNPADHDRALGGLARIEPERPGPFERRAHHVGQRGSGAGTGE